MKHTRKRNNGMTKNMLILPVFLVAVVALILGATAPEGWSDPPPVFKVFLEFNSTDEDLGFQVFADTGGIVWAAIYDPYGNEIFAGETSEGLGADGIEGIAELFFESVEPGLDEVDLDEFYGYFPEGKYIFEGTDADGKKVKAFDMLSHDLPDATVIKVEDFPYISWTEVDGAVGYQVIVEQAKPLLVFQVDLPASVTSVTVPDAFINATSNTKTEVIVISPNGNKTITEIEN